MGVRISWLMFARNSVFADAGLLRLAARALEVRVRALERARVAAQPLLLAATPLDVAQRDRAQPLAAELERADRHGHGHGAAVGRVRRELEARAALERGERVALTDLRRRALEVGQELRERRAGEPDRIGAEQRTRGSVVERDGPVAADHDHRVAHRFEDPARQRLALLERGGEALLDQLARRARGDAAHQRGIVGRLRQRAVVHRGQHAEHLSVGREHDRAHVAAHAELARAAARRGTPPARGRGTRSTPRRSRRRTGCPTSRCCTPLVTPWPSHIATVSSESSPCSTERQAKRVPSAWASPFTSAGKKASPRACAVSSRSARMRCSALGSIAARSFIRPRPPKSLFGQRPNALNARKRIRGRIPARRKRPHEARARAPSRRPSRLHSRQHRAAGPSAGLEETCRTI